MHCSWYSLGPLAGGGRVSEASNRDVVESGDIERVRVRVWINEPPPRIFGLETLEALVASVPLGAVVAPGKSEGDRTRTRLNSSHSCASRMPYVGRKHKYINDNKEHSTE